MKVDGSCEPRALVRETDFRTGRFHAQWLDDWLASPRLPSGEATAEETLLAAVCLSLDDGRAAPETAHHQTRWRDTARSEGLRSGEGRLRR